MLKNLKRYENLGTPNYFLELLKLLKGGGKDWTKKNIQEYFFNRMIDERNVFDGCLPFLMTFEVIKNSRGLIILNIELEEHKLNKKYICYKILENVFLKLKTGEEFNIIFNSKNISYDIVYRSIQISNSAFSFKYSNFKQLLIDLNFLSRHPDKKINKLIVNPGYRRFFDKLIIPEIKKCKVGIDEFQKILEQRQKNGEEAEYFVLKFEKERLSDNPKYDKIEKVSDYDVYAGYDIASYNSVKSSEIDRFIEVKSFFKKISFYWTKNEIDVARIKKDNYFLYLVDRNKLNEKDYTPMIIQNPNQEVLKNDEKWNKRVEKYIISL